MKLSSLTFPFESSSLPSRKAPAVRAVFFGKAAPGGARSGGSVRQITDASMGTTVWTRVGLEYLEPVYPVPSLPRSL